MEDFQARLQQSWDRFTQWWIDLHFTTTQRRTLGAVAGVLIALSLFVVFSGKSEEVLAESVVPTQMVAPALVIDVTGEVVSPGVYELPAGSRVIDAIKAAGGARPKAALSDLNLARVIKDGEQIYVDLIYTSGARVRAGAKTSGPRGPININRATASELDSLDGIGPVIAKRIIAYRTTNGAFVAIEDLLKVSGIGDAKFAQFKEKIRV
ncbi:MAG: ComEA family DNA-binding protein [Actinobacteria bacterium]|nr:ComEA family DNA-binding protein [Actinomycetota bacterium]NDA94982.1 ComEA family DNA-binding protein [Actinomycetota bacterium]NDI07507.1 ComEA family DNA-binding protein [Actinomycetota bacterium]